MKRAPRTVTGRIGPLTVFAALALVAACRNGGDKPAAAGKTILQNKGSDTMVNVAQVWAERYREVDPSVEIEVSGGGSGVGIAALIRGTVDLVNSSRDMKPDEIEQAKRNTGKTPTGFVVGYDALAVYVNQANPLSEITLEQLAGIYKEGGTLNHWSQLGVKIPGVQDDTIVLVSRQSSSGTYEFFREHVLGKQDFRLGSRDLNGSKEVVELVGSTPTALGYSGMGYATASVKMLALAPKPGAAVAPSAAAVNDKSYPLARSLHIYTLGDPEGATKRYIDWILSPAGQQIVQESGYVPLPSTPAAH